MIKALSVSGAIALIALVALFFAPAGRTEPFGTVFRTAVATALLVLMGRLVGGAAHRRPPNPVARNVVITMFATVAVLVLSGLFSPNWSAALAVWYLTLLAAGVLLNRWCEAPERYAILVATFCVVSTSLILMALAAARTPTQSDLVSNTVLLAFWPNVTKIAAHPGDAAWMWLAWRVADRLRPAEARRVKPPLVVKQIPLPRKR